MLIKYVYWPAVDIEVIVARAVCGSVMLPAWIEAIIISEQRTEYRVEQRTKYYVDIMFCLKWLGGRQDFSMGGGGRMAGDGLTVSK